MEFTANDLSRTHGANSWAQHHTETSRISRGRDPRQTERRSAAGKCINAERNPARRELPLERMMNAEDLVKRWGIWLQEPRCFLCDPFFFSPHRHLVAETVMASKGKANKMGSTTTRFPWERSSTYMIRKISIIRAKTTACESVWKVLYFHQSFLLTFVR